MSALVAPPLAPLSARPRATRRGIVVILFAALLVLISGTPANADPDPEGATASLAEKLEASARGYYDAKAVLDASKARQTEIAEKLRIAELSLARLER